jgi:hypothetical protein
MSASDGSQPLADPAHTSAIHAIRSAIDERLEHLPGLLDDFMLEGNRMALFEARDQLFLITRDVDALERLGVPMSNRACYADSPSSVAAARPPA